MLVRTLQGTSYTFTSSSERRYRSRAFAWKVRRPTRHHSPLSSFVLSSAPPPVLLDAVHSHSAATNRFTASGHGPLGPSLTFHPRGFTPPRRFTPASRPQVYCNLKPEGVRCVSPLEHPPVRPESLPGPMVLVPATHAPFEEISLVSSPDRITATCCPPAVHPESDLGPRRIPFRCLTTLDHRCRTH